MSRLMESVLKLVQVDKGKGAQKNKKHSRRKGRNGSRQLQYADSFIFVPADPSAAVVPSRVNANTFAEDNILTSQQQQRVTLVTGMNLGKSIKLRISQEVEDVSTNDHVLRHDSSHHQQARTNGSFTGESTHFSRSNHSLNNPQFPHPSDSTTLEIHCPPGERYCQVRPYPDTSVATEYARPIDCVTTVRPVASWHQSLESDLDSIGEGIWIVLWYM